MRLLTKIEQDRLELLTEKLISVTLIEPTTTGLKKSILDATGSVRNYLLKEKLHDYGTQKQGQDYKVILDAFLIDKDKRVSSRASLYRPTTKKGDPRIWFKGLPKISEASDIIAILGFEGKLYVFNLTHLDLTRILESREPHPIKEIIDTINAESTLVSDELLGKLYKIAAQGPIKSLVNADTGIGRTLEKLLGVDINSSKSPDYKGIELKSFRSKRSNRKTLFAQVPDWKLSKFKSSAEILDNFGYWRGEDFKLYCTVSTISRNPQSLQLKLNTDINQLLENSNKKGIGDFVVWTLDKLHNRLLTKHNETFWIQAESIKIDGEEYFKYELAEHTQKPIVSQFDILIEQGAITLDHLIKRNAKGRVVEKGPLFKIKPKSLNLLFPPSKKYDLLNT